MTCTILHLSDIHIHLDNDHILKRADAISRATFPSLRQSSHIFIVVSGDIAQSGVEAEYSLAEKFLKEISKNILKEKNIEISFIISPGNHDCILKANDNVRPAVLNN